MITVEIKVNGSLIAAVNAINRKFTGKEHPTRGPQCEYEWTSAIFPMSLSGPVETHCGKLTHHRDDGAVELIRAICAAHVKAAKAPD